ncbi:MAG: serine/threonine protein kinase [Planctomycetes bacterium]|nr:serine/threonine protein kinase [Planctomycetota bacterium]
MRRSKRSRFQPTFPVLPPRYAPIHKLGEGGFGVVLLAKDSLTRQDVAVKVLKASGWASHQARFRREVEGTKVLHSDRIIRVLDDDLAHDPPYYVMPYLKGGSLRGRIVALAAQRLVFDQVSALIATGTILQGLQIAHDAGVHHRDLKPENLLLDDAGQLVLTDFGLGEFVHRHSMVLTTGGLGTQTYVAPEQWATGDGSPAADFFSLGIVMGELLTGQPSRAPLVLRDARIPPPVDVLFRRLTDLRPEARFATCAHALATLDSILRNTYSTSRPWRLDWEWLKAKVVSIFTG